MNRDNFKYTDDMKKYVEEVTKELRNKGYPDITFNLSPLKNDWISEQYYHNENVKKVWNIIKDLLTK